MQVIATAAEMKEVRQQLKGSVGLVPTMGYLHEGHLTLARRAKAENDFAIATIFVNPTQFGPHEDFASYPRDPERDLAMLREVKTDFVFMPTPAVMYPAGSDTWVEVGAVTKRLEGAARPGHFRGVATVVTKLFNITQPTKAYFGQKDAQQCLVIKKMVTDLNMNLQVVIVPTVREPDGLAMSSRNTYLNPEERKASVVLFQALQLAQRLYARGERDANRIRGEMTALIQREPLAKIEYVSLAHGETLEELTNVAPPALALLAVRIGKTKLIDNIVVA
ncbi:MAG: pantoate--beta-alanine ligase [Chloroflexi bacterium]|nr:pantoate--beta-alanine ligase [Chloroflexota bacterium]